jgi:hypothetical protein
LAVLETGSMRWLLVLALVATQLQSWSGGALYLCLKSDGSLCCIDEGPDSCTCCDHETFEHEESPAKSPSGWRLLDPACRSHVLVLCERAPMMCRTSVVSTVDRDSLIALPSADALNALAGDALGADRSCRVPGTNGWAPSSADFSPVVLRC